MSDEEKKKLAEDEEMASVVETLRTQLKKSDGEKTTAIKEIENNFYAKLDEEQAKHDKEVEELNKRISDNEEKAKERIDDMEKKYGRMAFGGQAKDGRTPDQEKQIEAFLAYTRKGEAGLHEFDRKYGDSSETKAYNIESDTSGGYLQLPPVMSTEILDQAVHEVTPALSLAKVVTLRGNETQIPAVTAHAVSTWVADAGTTSADTTLALGKETIRVDQMTTLLQSGRTLLMDSAFNIESLFKDEVSKAMGLLLGTGFCTGNGVGKPEGITINDNITTNNVVNSGSASTLTAGGTSGKGLNGLYWNPKTVYTNNAKWLMRRATMMVCYGLVDGQGQYLLRWGLNQLEGKPTWSIMGSSCIESPDMPAISSNAYAIGFGDFEKGYKIVLNENMTMLKDPYTNKTTNIVDFMFWSRAGGGVVVPEAIHLQKIAA